MPNFKDKRFQFGSQLQLTVLSAEIIKRQLDKKINISISCNISELPNYHCNLMFKRKKQDIGPIGLLKFDDKRPLANAIINLGEENFLELLNLLKSIPPRNASIFLYTDSYDEEYLLNRSKISSGLSIDIRDVSWRYPLI